MTGLERKLVDIVRPEAEGMGLVLWGLTAPSAGNKRIVRIYLEGPDGVTIDQCAKLSRQVGVILEVEDIIPGSYTLEVSSPGLERRFFTPDQMSGYLGREIDVTLSQAMDGRRSFKGVLESVEGERFTVRVKDEPVSLDWSGVKQARLVHEF